MYRLNGTEVERDDLFRFRLYPKAGAPDGLDPIHFAAETIGQGLAAQKYAGTFYADSAIPSMALVSDQSITREQAQMTRLNWEAAHKGRRGTAVMGNGLKPVPLNVDPEKAQVVESQRFTLQQVARYFGIPPELIGADSGNPKSYNNQESRDLDYLKYGVGSKIAKLETALNALMPRAQYVKFNTGALLRTDTKTRYETHEIGIRAGFLTVNEARALEDWSRCRTGRPARPGWRWSRRDPQPRDRRGAPPPRRRHRPARVRHARPVRRDRRGHRVRQDVPGGLRPARAGRRGGRAADVELCALHPRSGDVLPVGITTAFTDTAAGLDGEWEILPTEFGSDVLTLIRAKAVRYLSAGFVEGRNRWHSRDAVTRVTASLDHASVVRRPAYPNARLVPLRASTTLRQLIARMRLR